MKRLFLAGLFLLTGCTAVPDGLEPVKGFKLPDYLGLWYEQVRLDHSFERDLSRVSASYSLNEDGSVKVINRGYNASSGEWEEAEGRAVFVGDRDSGHLKVSFFGPFYSSYVILSLDKDNYQWSLVSGPNRDYFWILSREENLPDEQLGRLLQLAEEMGFQTGGLIDGQSGKPVNAP